MSINYAVSTHLPETMDESTRHSTTDRQTDPGTSSDQPKEDPDTKLLTTLLDLQVPSDLELSPDARRMVYRTSLEMQHRIGEHTKSTLWIAKTGGKQSSRNLTTGAFNDRLPCWSPDGKRIAFVSDRAEPGKKCAVYFLYVGDFDDETGTLAEPIAITDEACEKDITTLRWSPNGDDIAYVSADEKTPEQRKKEEDRDDAEVWDAEWETQRLRVHNLVTGERRVLAIPQDSGIKNKHVTDVVWSPAGNELALSTAYSPYVDQHFLYGTSLFVVGTNLQDLKSLVTLPRKIDYLSWFGKTRALYFSAGVPADETMTGIGVYVIFLADKETHYYPVLEYGLHEDAAGIKAVGDQVVVKVNSRLDTRFDILGHLGGSIVRQQANITAWSAQYDPCSKEIVLAFVSSDLNNPAEVYTCRSPAPSAPVMGMSQAVNQPKQPTLTQVSLHGASLDSYTFGTFTPIETTSFDKDVKLDAMFLTPYKSLTNSNDNSSPRTTTSFPPHALADTASAVPNSSDDNLTTDPQISQQPLSSCQPSSGPSPIRTIVMPHGGPTDRNTNRFNAYIYYLAPYLLSHNIAILLLNYRGSSAYGSKFAQYARGGVGGVEYEDVLACTHRAIDLGLADPERLVIGGWSQGGFLSYLSAIRANNPGVEKAKFGYDRTWTWRAAIPGAGITDWDAMALTSDLGGSIEPELAGLAPWHAKKTDTRSRNGSALWEFSEAVRRGKEKGLDNAGIPPMLMLHGKLDERCPMTQAVGMRRALESEGLEFKMVMYPREEHRFKERLHWVDLVKRWTDWCEKYM